MCYSAELKKEVILLLTFKCYFFCSLFTVGYTILSHYPGEEQYIQRQDYTRVGICCFRLGYMKKKKILHLFVQIFANKDNVQYLSVFKKILCRVLIFLKIKNLKLNFNFNNKAMKY